MSGRSSAGAEHAKHDAALRDPHDVIGRGAPPPMAAALRVRVRGEFWAALEATGSTLLVTREYEHLVMALSVGDGGPATSWLGLPHPSGMALDRERADVHIASTRNPNEIVTLHPVRGGAAPRPRVLFPARTQIFPGRLYLHDLAVIDGALYGNAVGLNVVARISDGRATAAWWPRSVEHRGRPRSDRNYIQLNSIAAGKDLASSFFTASSASPGSRRPGQLNYPVDGTGVVFSGATREVIAEGLTRPHSARLHRRQLWVANSGYGELGWIESGRFRPLAKLPGWTRGLTLHGDVAFVGTSRVLPRFTRYAPGLRGSDAWCGVHAVSLKDGAILGSLLWPAGNQIFALCLVPRRLAEALPFTRRGQEAARRRFAYAFERIT